MEKLGLPRWPTIASLFACTVMAILARGYGFPRGDQNLYLPYVLQWLNPRLFPHDPLLTLSFARESILWPSLALAGHWFSLSSIVLALYVLASFLTLWFIYHIALHLWQNADAAWVAVFLWMPAYAVPGVANTTFDDYLATRVLGNLAGLAAFYCFVRQRPRWSAWALFVGGLIHIISVGPIAAGLALAHTRARRWRALAAIMVSLGGAAAIMLMISASGGLHQALWVHYTGEWLEIVRHGNWEVFPLEAPISAWGRNALYIGAFFALVKIVSHEDGAGIDTGEIVAVGSGILGASLIGIVGASLGIALIAQLCFLRGHLYLMAFDALMLAGPVARRLRGPWVSTAMAAAIAAAWATDRGALQAGALLLLVPWCLTSNRQTNRFPSWLARLGTIETILVIGGLFLLGTALRFYQPFTFALPLLDRAAILWVAVIVFVAVAVALVAPRIFARRAGLLLPASFGLLLVLAPSPFMKTYLYRQPLLRRVYGRADVMEVIRMAREARDGQAVEHMAELIRQKTPEDATILVPPSWMAFRVTALRSPFVTYKDEAPSTYDRAYAEGWLRRVVETGGLEFPSWKMNPEPAWTEEWLIRLAAQSGERRLGYAVCRKDLNLPQIGKVGPWKLYDLREEKPAGTIP